MLLNVWGGLWWSGCVSVVLCVCMLLVAVGCMHGCCPIGQWFVGGQFMLVIGLFYASCLSPNLGGYCMLHMHFLGIVSL